MISTKRVKTRDTAGNWNFKTPVSQLTVISDVLTNILSELDRKKELALQESVPVTWHALTKALQKVIRS